MSFDPRDVIRSVMERQAADKADTPEGAQKLFDAYKEKHPGTKKRPADFYDEPKDKSKKDDSEKAETKQDKGDAKKKKVDKKRRRKERQKYDHYEAQGREKAKKFLKDSDEDAVIAEAKKILKDLDAGKDLDKALKEHKEQQPDYYSGSTRKQEWGYQQAILSKYKAMTKGSQSKKEKARRGTKVRDLAKKHKIPESGLTALRDLARKQMQPKAKKALSDEEFELWRKGSGDPYSVLGSNWRKWYDLDKKVTQLFMHAKTPAEQKRDFMKAMKDKDPKTRQRIMKMSDAEFKAMMGAILDEEEMETPKGKKASLRSGLIRLAYVNPELRERLLPLIKTARNLPTLSPLAKRWWRAPLGGMGHPVAWFVAFEMGTDVPVDKAELRDIHKRLKILINDVDTELQQMFGVYGTEAVDVEPTEITDDDAYCDGSIAVDLTWTLKVILRDAAKRGFTFDPKMLRMFWPVMLDICFKENNWYQAPINQDTYSLDLKSMTLPGIEAEAESELDYAVSVAQEIVLDTVGYGGYAGFQFSWDFSGTVALVED